MGIAPGMFGIAVREQHDGARTPFGKPVGDVQLRPRPGGFGGQDHRAPSHTKFPPFALSLSKGRSFCWLRPTQAGASTSSSEEGPEGKWCVRTLDICWWAKAS